LFQSNPDKKAFGYLPSGWTRSVEGAWRSADRRLKTIRRNNRRLGRLLTHLCNINLDASRHPALINRDFKAFLKSLEKRQVSGHWTIQITRNNIVHWHLLFQNYRGNKKSLKRLVHRCLNEVASFPSRRVYTDDIKNQRQTLEYVLQVKKSGHGTPFNPLDKTASRSRVQQDIYARDRVLFKSGTGLAKNGTFGDFWAKGWNEKKWWNHIREETAEVARNYKHPQIRKFVDDLHARLGIPLALVKWAYCLNPPWHLIAERKVRSSSRGSRRARRRSSGLVGQLFLPRHTIARPRRLRVAPAPVGSSLVAFGSALAQDAGYPVEARVAAINRLPAGSRPRALEGRGSIELVCRRLLASLRHGLHQGPPYRSLAP